MLQEIRERAQGWVAWAIVILITIPFAFWGIDSYFGGGAEPVVASVNGTEITERAFNQNVNHTRIRLRDQLGDAYDPALFGDARLRQEVLDRMIRETLLLDASQSMGLRTADQAVQAAVLEEPAFQQDGVYSKAQYERVLSLQGLTPAAYEDSLRRQLLVTQLPRAIQETAFATNAMTQRSASLVLQKRSFAYTSIPGSGFESAVEDPDAAAVESYFDAHADEFATPEQVKIAYLLLDSEGLAAPNEEIDEAVLREQYQLRLDEFTAPEERNLRHILLTVPAEAPKAELDDARQRLEAIRQRIVAGESFEDLAAEVSEDPGSATNGGALGWIGRGALDPAFEQAVFELDPGQLSGTVRSRFGYHLAEVIEVRGGEPEPFEAVKDQLISELASGSTEAVYFEQAEQLATLTYESPDSLIPAAEALGLEVQETDWLDRSGGDDVFANPRVVQAAFSEEVLGLGNNSELLEPDPEGLQALVLRVVEHREPSVRSLDDVRDEIVARLKAERAAEAALAAAEAIAERVRAGEALADAAGEFDTTEVEQAGRATTDVPPEIVGLAFTMLRPGADGEVMVESTSTGTGDAYVVALSKVIDADPGTLNEAELDLEARVLRRGLASTDVEQVLESMAAQAKIERKPVVTEDAPF